jgi:dihydroflavonol-4-reductase
MASKGLVLVTGATGFVAGHVIQQLLAAGYHVRGTVRSDKGPKVAHLLLMGENLHLVCIDLLTPDGWDDAARDCDYCMHVASPVAMNVNERDADTLIRPAGKLSSTHALAKSASSFCLHCY